MPGKFCRLNVADNSGAKLAMLIGIIKKGRKSDASVGDVVVVTIKKAIPNGAVKKSDVVKAVLVRTSKIISRSPYGEYVRFGDNAVVLLNDDFSMKGTRVMGPIAREIKKDSRLSKIVALAPEII
jgi:large subunit ribosomal protein L14